LTSRNPLWTHGPSPCMITEARRAGADKREFRGGQRLLSASRRSLRVRRTDSVRRLAQFREGEKGPSMDLKFGLVMDFGTPTRTLDQQIERYRDVVEAAGAYGFDS